MFRVPHAAFPSVLLSLLWLTLLHPFAAFAQAEPSALAAAGVNARTPPLGMIPARGNGHADDTAALQAEIRYCQFHGVPLLLAPGVYLISSPLHISLVDPVNPADQYTGTVIKGVNGPALNTSYRDGTPQGATILMTGQRQDALIVTDAAPSYYIQIADLTLDGGTDALATKYALHASFTNWSGLRLDNVITKNTNTALAVGPPVGSAFGTHGGNGEELDCYSCHFNARHTAYLNTSDSGQAYLHHFFACSVYISRPGGVAFEIGNGNLGCQCDFYGTSLTMIKTGKEVPGSPANVFFQDDGTSDPINWWGGRAEGVDTLIKWNGGSGNEIGHVNIQGMAFPNARAIGAPLFSGGGTNCNYWFTVRSCYFQNGGRPVPLGFTYGGGGFEHIKLEECDFLNYSDLTALVNSPHIYLSDCRYLGADGIAHDLKHRQAAPIEEVPVKKVPVKKSPAKKAPVKKAPVKHHR